MNTEARRAGLHTGADDTGCMAYPCHCIIVGVGTGGVALPADRALGLVDGGLPGRWRLRSGQYQSLLRTTRRAGSAAGRAGLYGADRVVRRDPLESLCGYLRAARSLSWP